MLRCFTCAFAISVCAMSVSLAAAQQPAPVSDLISAVDIPYKEFTLVNGLRVFVHDDRKSPILSFSVWYNVLSPTYPPLTTAFAPLFYLFSFSYLSFVFIFFFFFLSLFSLFFLLLFFSF